MLLSTVILNLENTIAGKQLLLQELSKVGRQQAVMQFLQINIEELQKILKDLKAVAQPENLSADLDGPMIKLFRDD